MNTPDEFKPRPRDNVLPYEAEVARMAFTNARTALRAHSQLSTKERLAELSKLKQTILAHRSMIIARVMEGTHWLRKFSAPLIGSTGWRKMPSVC
ncbi:MULTISPECIES: hypothetical protein [unclassified Pseudomonas]|uniref:hypothetical protein n=1 Tax=unclassified Pseudomonas TaxID=196821 RepID=UPI0021149BB3|nr:MULTISPECIES: hypothetical protein [unclassified Pseudomonas]